MATECDQILGGRFDALPVCGDVWVNVSAADLRSTDADMDCSLSAVCDFVASELSIAPGRLDARTRIFHDLGVDGDDGIEFLEAFADNFGVDMADCDPRRYFGPEGFFDPRDLWDRLRARSARPIEPLTIEMLVLSAAQRRWIVAMPE